MLTIPSKYWLTSMAGAVLMDIGSHGHWPIADRFALALGGFCFAMVLVSEKLEGIRRALPPQPSSHKGTNHD